MSHAKSNFAVSFHWRKVHVHVDVIQIICLFLLLGLKRGWDSWDGEITSRSGIYIGYNPMIRAVWLNTSPRRRPRAVRPEGGVEGWCPAIPHGPLGCILLTTIMRGKECFCGRWTSKFIEWQTCEKFENHCPHRFVSFGRRSSIKTSNSSSYSDASRLISLGSSPFEQISEYHSWKTAFHRPFSFRIFQPCGMA